MLSKKIHVLLVEDNKGDYLILLNQLKDSGIDYELKWYIKIEDAIKYLENNAADIMLLDLGLAESKGIDTVKRVLSFVDTLPVVVLTGLNDGETAIEAVKHGVQDYLVKGEYNPDSLVRVIRYAMERKESESLIIKQRNELQNIIEIKDKFFAILAHDLRGPFSSIYNLLKVINEDYNSLSDDNRRKMLFTLEESARSTNDLLENLLTWSRLQRGKISPEYQQTNIPEIVNQVVVDLGANARDKKIEIMHPRSGIREITADPSMITTVIRNLVSNSIKYTNKGGRINIDYKIKDSNLLIIVSDNGTGMSEEQIRDFRDKQTMSSEYGTEGEKGTGLGLSLCREFVKLHSGEIKIESEIDKGTEFIISIPVEQT